MILYYSSNFAEMIKSVRYELQYFALVHQFNIDRLVMNANKNQPDQY
jgi:hypothetical protein